MMMLNISNDINELVEAKSHKIRHPNQIQNLFFNPEKSKELLINLKRFYLSVWYSYKRSGYSVHYLQPQCF